MYLFLLLIGALGFMAMTLLGLGHGIGGGRHAGLGSHGAGPAAGQGHAALTGHAHTGGHIHHNGAAHAPAQGAHHGSEAAKLETAQSIASKLLIVISPLDVFSLALGAGATGILFAALIPAHFLPWAAVLGAFVFDFAVIKPLIGMMARFVSRPSEGLEGEVAKTAEAVTAFDRGGKGLVKLCLDGQLVQLLANLDPSERANGIAVAKGDTVLVIEVDPVRNVCTVSRDLVSSLADERDGASSQARR